tara:strand:+ start:3465 stop:3935 length:471 start_codon:yes stop_codon:yes gene_type:complete
MMPRKRQIYIEIQCDTTHDVYRFRDEVYVAIDIDEPKPSRLITGPSTHYRVKDIPRINFYAWDTHLDEIEAHLINEHSDKRGGDAFPYMDGIDGYPELLIHFLKWGQSKRTVLMVYDDEVVIVKPLNRQKFLASEKKYETDITVDVPRKRLLMIEG